MEWLTKFPEMDRSGLREFKKTVDNAFTSFSRNYGEGIENFFDPLLSFLVCIFLQDNISKKHLNFFS